MNKERRKQLSEAISLLEQAHAVIEDVLQGEQDALMQIPENLQSSERASEDIDDLQIATE